MWLRREEEKQIEEKIDSMADQHICKCGHSAKHHYSGYTGDPMCDLGLVICNASDKKCMYWDWGKEELCSCESFQRVMVSLCYFPKEKL